MDILFDDALLFAWEWANINFKYPKIVNYEPYKSPLDNESYNSRFTQSHEERSDDQMFSLQKSLWFKRMRFREWEFDNAWTTETDLVPFSVSSPSGTDELDLDITDVKFIDGTRFLFAVNKDSSKMWVFKQIRAQDYDKCAEIEDLDVTIGNFVNISNPRDLWDTSAITPRFTFAECIHKKFSVTEYGKWIPVDFWTNWQIRNELIWTKTFTYFYDAVNPISALAGQYVMLYRGSFATQLRWISATWMTTSNPPVITNALLMETFFAWFLNVNNWQWTLALNIAGSVVSVPQQPSLLTEDSQAHSWAVFPDIWDILVFATRWWMRFLNYHGDRPSQSVFLFEWGTFNEATPPYVMSSIALHQNNFYFLDQKRNGRIYGGLSWFNKFYFDSRNSYSFGNTYTNIESLGGVFLLLWPNRLAWIEPTIGSSFDFVTYSPETIIEEWIGYLNKYSWAMNRGSLYLLASDHTIFNLSFNIFGVWKYQPQIARQQCRYQSDLDLIRRWYENAYIDVTNDNIYVFINTTLNNPNPNTEEEFNPWWATKVLIRNTHYSFRYMFLRPWIRVSHYDNHTWYGQWVFSREWYKDTDSITWNLIDYKTLLWYRHGKDSIWYGKMNHFFDTIIWYNSYITKDNTFVKFNVSFGGRYMSKTQWNLYRTDYVWNLMQIKNTGNISNTFKNYPIWWEIQWWNWSWYIQNQYQELWKENMEEFNQYSLLQSGDTREDSLIKLAKFSPIQFPIQMEWETIDIEIWTKWSDRLEFLGGKLWYSILNTDWARLENVSTFTDYEHSGPSGFPLTKDSGTWNN